MSSEKQRTAWEKQMLVREKNRPTIHDYLPRIFEEFFELHGDRGYGDDGAILGGIARLNGVPSSQKSKVATLRKTNAPTLQCRIRRATGKRCGWQSKRKSSIARLSALLIRREHSVAWKQKNGDRAKPLRKTWRNLCP